jgi:nickel-dependent lactate racemase
MKGVDMVIDEDRNLAHVGFGDIVESHEAAVDFVRASTEVSVDRRFKTVVTSVAGYPLDATYDETVKDMVTPMDIMEPEPR